MASTPIGVDFRLMPGTIGAKMKSTAPLAVAADCGSAAPGLAARAWSRLLKSACGSSMDLATAAGAEARAWAALEPVTALP